MTTKIFEIIHLVDVMFLLDITDLASLTEIFFILLVERNLFNYPFHLVSIYVILNIVFPPLKLMFGRGK